MFWAKGIIRKHDIEGAKIEALEDQKGTKKVKPMPKE